DGQHRVDGVAVRLLHHAAVAPLPRRVGGATEEGDIEAVQRPHARLRAVQAGGGQTGSDARDDSVAGLLVPSPAATAAEGSREGGLLGCRRCLGGSPNLSPESVTTSVRAGSGRPSRRTGNAARIAVTGCSSPGRRGR